MSKGQKRSNREAKKPKSEKNTKKKGVAPAASSFASALTKAKLGPAPSSTKKK